MLFLDIFSQLLCIVCGCGCEYVCTKLKVKSLSHVRLCKPMDGSPPGSSIHGILQARILAWVAIFFSRGSSGPGIELRSPALQADSLPFEPPGNPDMCIISIYFFIVFSSLLYLLFIVAIWSLSHVWLWDPHGLQHARLPRPSLSSGVCLNSGALSQWCHPAIASSVIPVPSCLRSFPAYSFYYMLTYKTLTFVHDNVPVTLCLPSHGTLFFSSFVSL